MGSPIFFDYRANPNMIDLINQGGQAQAEYARRQAEMFAGAFQGVGQAVGGAIQQHQEQKRQSKNEQALLSAMDSWDDNDPQGSAKRLVQVAGPEGLKLAQGYMALRKNAENDDPKSHLMTSRAGVAFFKNLSPEGKAQAYPRLLQSLAPTGEKLKIDPSMVPMEYGPEAEAFLDNFVGATDAYLGMKAEKGDAPKPGSFEAFVAAKGATTPEQQIAARQEWEAAGRAPAKAEAGPAVGSFEDYLVQKFGPRPNAQQIEQARKGYAAADNQAKSATTLSPTAESNIINRLSGQWMKADKTDKELKRQLTVMDTGLSEAEKGNLNAGSQAVLMTFNKILDPDSVVKEGEFARSASGQSLLNRAQGAFEKLTKGGQGVPVSELKQYAKLAREIVEKNGGSLEGTRRRISATAKRYNIPEELVMEMAPDASGTVQPSSKAEYDALPSGTRYIDKNGTLKVKK